MLVSGKAFQKMREIIAAQGGNPDISSKKLMPGKNIFEQKSNMKGKVSKIDNQHITVVARVLGCPSDKKAGVYLNSKLDEVIYKGDILCTIYSSDKWRLKEAIETLKNFPIYSIQ
jgi:AMP phosphorylase